MASCGSQTPTTDSIPIEAKVEHTVASNKTTTLNINKGSAKGASLIVPKNTLAKGTVLALDKVSKPDSFSAASSVEDGSAFSSASSAISISNSNNTKTLSKPMTIAIPIGTSASLRFWLTAIEKKKENICAFLESETGENFVWRNEDMTISSSKVSFRSKHFGVYQLFYCGDARISTFEDAEEAGVSAPPPSENESDDGDLVTFNFSIDGSKYGYNRDHFCLVIGYESIDDSLNSTHYSIASQMKVINSSATTDFELELNTFLIPDETNPFVFVYTMLDSSRCDFTEQEELSSMPEFLSAHLFHVTKDQLSNNEFYGTFGEGSLETQTYTIANSNPSSNISASQLSASAQVCIHGKTSDESDSEKIIFESFINNEALAAGGFNSAAELPFYMIGSKEQNNINMIVGGSCDTESDSSFDDNSYPYSVKLNTELDNKFYVMPVEISATLEPFKSLNRNIEICLGLYNNDYISTKGQDIASSEDHRISLWQIQTQKSYVFLLPWDTSTTSENSNEDIPSFDFRISTQSDCYKDESSSAETIPKFRYGVNDIQMSNQILIQESIEGLPEIPDASSLPDTSDITDQVDSSGISDLLNIR